MLQQVVEQSRQVRAALARIEDSVDAAMGTDPHTVILDWLEAEMMAYNGNGSEIEDMRSRLLRQAVGLCSTCKR